MDPNTLSDLTPEPWEARGEGICCGLYKEPEHYLIFNPDGTWADTQFCALARNAFAGDPEALAWWEANRKHRENRP